MKKSLIAVAGASLAVAAMPVVSVFADATSSIVDTVRVTIADSCTIINSGDMPAPDPQDPTKPGSTVTPTANGTNITNTYSVEMTLGQLMQDIGGSEGTAGNGSSSDPTDPSANPETGGQATIVCNNVPSGVTPGVVPSGSPAASGAGSWKLSVQASDGGKMVGASTTETHEISTGTATSGANSAWAYKIAGIVNDYSAIPYGASATEIATGYGTVTIAPRYQVYIGTSQAADTYTGTVTYTLVSPAA